MNKNNLLEISNIKDLLSVKISRLLDTPDVKDPGVIIVFYEDGKKTLTYSEFDSEYLYFFSTIRRVYNEEKNHRKIYIDDLTEKILNANEPKIELNNLKNNIGHFGTEKKINYNKLEIEVFYNVLKYILEDLFNYFNKHIEIINIKGMGNNFKLVYKEDILEKYLPFTFIKNDDNSYKLIFAGVFNNMKELYVDLKYAEKIVVSLYNKEENLRILYECETTAIFGKITKSIFIDGNLNSKIVTELETTDIKEVNDYKIDGTSYKLPWNDVRTVKKDIQQNELITEIAKYTDYFQYLDHSQIREKIIQYVTRKGTGNKYENGIYKIAGDLTLKTDDELIVTNYYKVDDYLVKETTFYANHLTRGIYKSELEGKSFYKVYQIKEDNTLEEINKEITEDIKGYKLTNSRELKLLIKRSEL